MLCKISNPIFLSFYFGVVFFLSCRIAKWVPPFSPTSILPLRRRTTLLGSLLELLAFIFAVWLLGLWVAFPYFMETVLPSFEGAFSSGTFLVIGIFALSVILVITLLFVCAGAVFSFVFPDTFKRRVRQTKKILEKLQKAVKAIPDTFKAKKQLEEALQKSCQRLTLTGEALKKELTGSGKNLEKDPAEAYLSWVFEPWEEELFKHNRVDLYLFGLDKKTFSRLIEPY